MFVVFPGRTTWSRDVVVGAENDEKPAQKSKLL